MRITSYPTPNPNSLKFEANGRPFIEDGLLAAFSPDEAVGSPLGVALFSLPGVESLLITPDFVTVTKQPSTDWKPLLQEIEGALESWLDR